MSEPASASLRRRAAAFFALDDDWARPTPAVGRADVVLGVLLLALGLVTIELSRSSGGLGDPAGPWWVQYVVVAAGTLALVGRRRWPVAVACFLACHMFATGVTMPSVMAQVALQICYFVGLFSAMAWARDRRAALTASSLILLFMLCWVAWQFALGSGVQDYLDATGESERTGFLPAIPAAVALIFVINVLYFCGAIVGGQVAWRGARQRDRLAEQAETIEAQADSLRRRAVVEERLHLARELHDVVGHHVSVIGVQAAGARRVLGTEPDAAARALGTIEDTSREAVTQLRSLLGTLREIEGTDASGDGPADGTADGPAQPGAADLAALVEAVRSRTGGALAASYSLVEEADGAGARVPGPVGHALYRTAQEALANVVRHSTATRADVTLRVVERGASPYAEVEVLDDGRVRPGTSGSGLGHLGIRERVASHRGECEIGPRATGGYRVRVRLPLRPVGRTHEGEIRHVVDA